VHRLVTLTLKHEENTRDLIELMDYTGYADLCSEKSLAAKRASTQCTRLFHCLLMKSQGQRVFETLLFDLDQSGNISIYIDEVNMHHKIHLRDDSRIDSVIFFEEQLVIAAHVKPLRTGDNRNKD
jgi:exoribonuclease R